ncbi:MAG: polyprenol monophosphomannose synthase [Deltaproteobacteria bacterium]|nr:polyprenol monophosphomannose synthase [Deltaproteobacteria bacterium]
MTDAKTGSGVLVCIPTYNERENIELIVPRVLQELAGANVLVIDDNSPDGTGDLADEMAARDERVHVLHREEKQGLGRAYIAGFGWALERDYQYIIEFDADFSHNPVYLPEMAARLERSDVVVGSRRVPGGGVKNWSFSRRLVSLGGSLYARAILGISVKDLTGGFNGFRRSALETIDFRTIEATGYAFQLEIKYRAVKRGLKVEEMPIIFPDRTRGTSKMSSKIFREALMAVWKLRLGL